MIHPNTELRFINPQVGYGVFATAFIPKGTIVYVKDSLEIEVSPEDFSKHSYDMQEQIEKYSYIDERGYRIISWDFAKYVNHCCNCCSMSTGYGFEIALRDILPGEELTDEYGIFNMKYEMFCGCGQPGCRGKVSPSDFDEFHPVWDEKIKMALGDMYSVDQPLMGFIDHSTQNELMDYRKDPLKYKSVYSLKTKEFAEVSLEKVLAHRPKTNGQLKRK